MWWMRLTGKTIIIHRLFEGIEFLLKSFALSFCSSRISLFLEHLTLSIFFSFKDFILGPSYLNSIWYTMLWMTYWSVSPMSYSSCAWMSPIISLRFWTREQLPIWVDLGDGFRRSLPDIIFLTRCFLCSGSPSKLCLQSVWFFAWWRLSNS